MAESTSKLFCFLDEHCKKDQIAFDITAELSSLFMLHDRHKSALESDKDYRNSALYKYRENMIGETKSILTSLIDDNFSE